MKTLKDLEYWRGQAELGDQRAVLDPNDTVGAKNQFIDDVSRLALLHAVRNLEVSRFATAVDFGCGVGRLAPTLRGLADEVIGVDPVEPMLAIARRTHSASGVRFVTPDELPETLGQPLLVVSAFVLADNLDFDAAVEVLGSMRRRAGAGSACILLERDKTDVDSSGGSTESRTPDWYRSALVRAGWTPVSTRTFRRSSSPQLRFAVRVAPHLPGRARGIAVGWAAALEFRFAPRSRRHGEYSETCISATA
jgi:SAM-dependent methyltransferase